MPVSLNARITRTMIVLTLTALAVVYFGLMVYFSWIYEWLYPDASPDDSWKTGDTVMVVSLLAFGLLQKIVAYVEAKKLLEECGMQVLHEA